MAKHRDDDDVVVVEERGSVVGPFLLGLALGAALGLLFAPMSGAEMRSTLKARGRRLGELARHKMDELEEAVSGSYERAREKVEAGLDRARRGAKEGREMAQDVVEAGRAAATTAREELERRLAEARQARRTPRSSGEEEPVA
jgi:gas vesicle protein